MEVRENIGVQVFFGSGELSESEFIEVRNRKESNNLMKPHGGVWTSTYMTDNKYMSSWHRHCAHTEFGYRYEEHKTIPPSNAYLVHPKKSAKVLEIDSKESIIKFFDEYKIINNKNNKEYIDFEGLKKKYSGLRLTDNGACALSMLKEKTSHDIIEWDCESTLWLEFCFKECEKIHDKFSDY